MIKIAIALGVLVTTTLLMKKQGMSYRQSILKSIYQEKSKLQLM